jgi:aquaporin Z
LHIFAGIRINSAQNKDVDKNMIAQLLAEFTGTVILSSIIGITLDATWSNGLQTFYSPYAVGIALASAMVATGFVSGAHFNPAVTVAVILRDFLDRNQSAKLLVKHGLYIFSQIAGAFVGASFAYAMTSKTNYIDIGTETGDGAAFFAEAFFTHLLASAALMAGNCSNNNIISGGAVAGTLFAAAMSIGAISGACLNPAVGIGVNIVALRKHSSACDHLWIYIIAPLVGSVTSAVLTFIFKKEHDRQMENNQINYVAQK